MLPETRNPQPSKSKQIQVFSEASMSRMFQLLAAACAILFIAGTASAQLKITSSAFTSGGPIPAKYTCDAPKPPNPPLAFSGVPANAKSLLLIVEDPDVPKNLM